MPKARRGEIWLIDLGFIQKTRPYATQVGLTPRRIAYLQALNVAVGLQSRVLPFEQVADLSPARGARKFL